MSPASGFFSASQRGKCAIGALIVEKRMRFKLTLARLPISDETNDYAMITTRIGGMNAAFQAYKAIRKEWSACLPLFKLDTLILGISLRSKKL